MAVTSTINKVQYNCNGINKDFTFTFRIFKPEDLTVILTDSAGQDQTLLYGTDYIVSPASGGYVNGGSVTVAASYASGNKLLIWRKLPYTHDLDLQIGGSIPAESVESLFDRITFFCQQISEENNRTVKTSPTDASINYLPPALSRAGKVLAFNAQGQPTVASPAEYMSIGALEEALQESREILTETEAAIATTNEAKDIAVTAKNAASVSAAAAESVKNSTEAAKNAAIAAKVSAESAMDAAMLAAGVYDDTTAGLAATTDGEYFSVPSAESNEFIILYKNNSGSALAIKTYPATAVITRLNNSSEKYGNLALQTYIAGVVEVTQDYVEAQTSGVAADDTFYGYGSKLDKVTGLSFNAIGLGTITRRPVADNLRWGKVIVEVRDVGATGTILASGTYYVHKTVSTANDVIVVLHDSDGAPITITDADLSATYFIGVYALTDDNEVAALNKPLGGTPNFEGTSYYMYSGAPGAWGGYNGNPDFAFQHCIITDPVETVRDIQIALTQENLVKTFNRETGLQLQTAVDGTIEATIETTSLQFQQAGILGMFGFGSKLNRVAGVSFNAIGLGTLSRRSDTALAHRWEKIVLEVRDVNQVGVLLASGTYYVNKEATIINDIVIVLRDASGAVKTITDADLSATYFVGYTAYTHDDLYAEINFPGGGVSNHNTSYYKYLTASWNAYAGNYNFGLRHLLIANYSESRKTAITGHINEYDNMPVALPPELYFVTGAETNVYFDNLIVYDASRFLFDIDCAYGSQQNERLIIASSVVISAKASTTVTLNVYNQYHRLLATKAATLYVAPANAGTGTLKCMFIGDSTTAAGTYTAELLNLATTDAALDIALLGTLGSGSNKHEGRSGWSIGNYYNSATVSGTVNPFYNSSSGFFDFAYYQTQTAQADPDWIFIHLGINDVFGVASDLSLAVSISAIIAKLNYIFASIQNYSAGIKIGLMITIPPSYNQDSFGANYAATYTRWRHKRNVVILANQLIASFGGLTSSNIYLVPVNSCLDTVNNMQKAAATSVNSRSSVTIVRQSNGVHPDTSGYNQMADAVWSFIKYHV